MSEGLHQTHERWGLGTELLWAFEVRVLITATISIIVFTALTRGINPPSNVVRVDPKTLHLSGEVAEQNLGTVVTVDGTVTALIITTQFIQFLMGAGDAADPPHQSAAGKEVAAGRPV
jgi:hypothetical protein